MSPLPAGTGFLGMVAGGKLIGALLAYSWAVGPSAQEMVLLGSQFLGAGYAMSTLLGLPPIASSALDGAAVRVRPWLRPRYLSSERCGGDRLWSGPASEARKQHQQFPAMWLPLMSSGLLRTGGEGERAM
jgi:hypothetical protein